MMYTIKVEPTDKSRNWKVVEDFKCGDIIVPAGFITDGASIPRGLRWLFPHGGRKFVAAVVHDYLYRNKAGTRLEADELFFRLMIHNGVPTWRAQMLFMGVRLGGWLTWQRKR